MGTRKGNVAYVLLNEENSTFETFETESDLLKFVKKEGFDEDELEDLRIVEVAQEYELASRSVELVQI